MSAKTIKIQFCRVALSASVVLAMVGCGQDIRPTRLMSSVTISPASRSLLVGQQGQLTAIATYNDGTTQDITATAAWVNASPSIATISASGSLSCLGLGTDRITVAGAPAPNGAAVDCNSPKVVGVRLSAAPAIVTSEAPFRYQALADYSDGTMHDVTTSTVWTTADPTVAAMTSDGVLLCNNPGTDTLTGTYSGNSVQAKYTCILRNITPQPEFKNTAETFEGPFASWVNLRTVFGAKGDGVTDDTAAVQAALNSLSKTPGVLWIPDGTYMISGPLTISGQQGFSIIGEDPLKTAIVWAGKGGGTMLTLSGCSGFDLGRLTLDGSGRADVAVEVTWDGSSNFYPTYNYIHDSRIVRVGSGIHSGWAGETTIDRVHFDHNTKAGISLGDWNALNWNVLDSLFTDNAIGITNIYGAGAFNVTDSVFVRSTVADIALGNTGPFSFRENLSVGSKTFLTTGATGAPANIVVQGNTVENPASTPIQTGTPGSLLILDNQFIGLDPASNVLFSYCYMPITFVSVGNTYAVAEPFAGNVGPMVVADEASRPDTPGPEIVVPSEVYFPEPSGRPIVEVPSGAEWATVQNAIDTASAINGVVHLPGGHYNIAQTINVPADSKIAIVGDGPPTTLVGGASIQGAILRASGGNVELRSMALSTYSSSPANALVEIDQQDSPNGRIFCDECAFGQSGLQVSGMDDTKIQLRVTTILSGGVAQSIHGGIARQDGVQTLGRLAELMTSTSDYVVDGGAIVLVEDGWHDVGQGPIQFAVSGTGDVTQEGGTIYSTSASAMTLDDYSGQLALLGVGANSYLTIDAASHSTVLSAGVVELSGGEPVANAGTGTSIVNLGNSSLVNGRMTTLANTSVSPATTEHLMSTARVTMPLRRTGAGSVGPVVSMKRVDMFSAPLGLLIKNPSPAVAKGTYTFAPSSGGRLAATCPSGQTPMTGRWTLQAGGDGYLGLLSQGAVLTERSDADGVGFGPAMISARDRWQMVDSGDGSMEIINRATGEALTWLTDGCASVSPRNGSASERWAMSSGQ